MLNQLLAVLLLSKQFVFTSAASHLRPKEDDWELIIGGYEATEGHFPYVVSLQNEGGHFCGGTLIAKDDGGTLPGCYFQLLQCDGGST